MPAAKVVSEVRFIEQSNTSFTGRAEKPPPDATEIAAGIS
jgi:hypothetical protein